MQTESDASPSVSAAAAPRRRWYRPRFSLRSLLLLVLLIGSGATLWWRWTPWLCILKFDGHDPGNQSATFSPDGRRIMTTGQRDDAIVRDATSGVQIATMECHQCAVPEFYPDGERVVTCGAFDNKLRIWSTTVSKELISVQLGSMFRSASLSPDGKQLMLTEYGPSVRLLDASTGEQKLAFGNEQDANPCDHPLFHPDGRKIIGANANEWKSWDTQTGKVLGSPSGKVPDEKSTIREIALSPDGRKLLTYSSTSAGPNEPILYDHFIRVWDVESGRILGVLDEPPSTPNEASFGKFSPDGQTILTGNGGSRLRIWDSNSLVRLIDMEIGEAVFGSTEVSYSPDSNRLLVATTYGPIFLYQRRHPESRLGVLYLPELWLTALLAAALIWSLGRDWRSMRSEVKMRA